METNRSAEFPSSDDQPSTSTANNSNVMKANEEEKTDKEMKQLLEATNEILENKAKSWNLTSLNVRSILHHLIKYPSTIDVLLGIRENNDLPSVRNMRSRKKPDEAGTSSSRNTPKKFALRIEDKGPKNFLDLEYDEDDEYDDDYVEEGDNTQKNGQEAGESEDEDMDDEEEDEEEEEEEDEDEEEDEEEASEINTEKGNISREKLTGEDASSADIIDDELNNLLYEEVIEDDDNFAMNMTLNDTRPGSVAIVHTIDNVVDDADYRNFVMSIQCPPEDFEHQAVYDEDDVEDEDYNVIADNLNVEDWDETRQDRTTLIPRHEVKALMMDTLLAEKDIPINMFPEETIQGEEIRKSQKDKDAEICERINQVTTSSIESCSLLKETPVVFRVQEIEQLQLQLEQHVQLLTQFVVTCNHDNSLGHVRNKAQIMINDLDNIRQRSEYPTVYEISNLNAAIESCHDIMGFPQVDEHLLNYAQNTDGHGGIALRPEAAAVLSRSEAIRFPGLLPPCQPMLVEKPIPFLNEEDVMLAIALLQFAHLPRRAEKGIVDRYTTIHQHCLPARDPYKIRTHLKSMRKSSKNPIHEIIQAAENGVCKISVPTKIWKRTDSPINTWPTVSQPGWFRHFSKIFNVTEDRKIHRKAEAVLLLTPSKYRERPNQSPSFALFDGQNGFDSHLAVDIGTTNDGRKIVLGREHIEEIVNKLKKEKGTPKKRRKNPTPMKLSTMIQLEQTSETRREDNRNKNKCSASASAIANRPATVPSKAIRRLDCSNLMKNSCLASVGPSTSSENHESFSYPVCEDLGKARFFCSSQNQSLPKDSTSHASSEDTNDSHHLVDGNSNSSFSFPIPPTPGRRSPDEHDDFFMDLETNSLMWTRQSYTVTQGNPQTPRCFSLEPDEADPVDFSCMNFYQDTDSDDLAFQPSTSCQQPMGCSSEMGDLSDSSSFPEAPSSSCYVHRDISESATEDDAVPGLDLVPIDEEVYDEEYIADLEGEDEEPPVKRGLVNSRPPLKFKKAIESGTTGFKASRKRTRMERESMGSVGLDDELYRESQKDIIMRKVIEDISQRLFMHKDTYQRFKNAIIDEKLSDVEKVSRIVLILANHPELLNLVLIYAPPEAVVSDFEFKTNFHSYKSAIEMIMDIERYITSAKLKEPSLRSLFRYIQSFLENDPKITDEQATKRFHQVFGQDRPLWKKLESKFWCLPFKSKPRLENFEYIDLTKMDSLSKKEKRDRNNVHPRFEIIDDIDQVMGNTYRPSKNDPPSNLVVKCGEMGIQNDDDSFVQLEINERTWTRKDDITLLTGYNEALKSIPNFTDSMMPSLVPDLPIGGKSIIARLQYLLEELKTIED
ncbi:hypothetical protein GCK72_014360 [Caenorhabditis remanei]|uniref:Uncharacterized protein n=1 Tax=Caenorhabditis remanei TaxID=31234 RepID=A0A6A5GTU8_CAERE|nr:hypothetical protein GCK72_014360 [Caenorhabditis remanei]KAF1757903.1 hypothetical protein GCK72_014360 [Caenorhabditis remanei]